MATSIPEFVLRNGAKIPSVGFGAGTAWFDLSGHVSGHPLNQNLISSLKSALSIGYRHLDAAEVYGTEREMGIAIKESGISRSDLFVTSKVWPGIGDPIKAAKESLSRLQLDYLDLYLIHAPFFSKETHGIDIPGAWRALEELFDQGLVKEIGVSNFRIGDLKILLANSKFKPAVNQIEFNPYLQSPDLVEFCRDNGILVEAYSPLAPIVRKTGGPLDPILQELSKKYTKTEGQVLLRWTIQKGVVAVTTSSKKERQAEQLAIGDFELSEEDIKKIDEEGSKLQFRKFWLQYFETPKL